MNDFSYKIPLSTHTSTYIDAPYGLVVSDDGIIYVAVKDDDSVAVIDGTSISYLFASRANGMDDPRDVAIGPAPTSGANGASGADGAPGASGPARDAPVTNSEPEFGVLSAEGVPMFAFEITSDTVSSFTVNGTDADGDSISYRLDGAPDFVTLTANSTADTATLAINATGISSGAYQFKIMANDGTEDEWNGYVILITEEES